MHDDIHMINQLEMEKCFQDGQFPCRWAPDLANGYGEPVFNYYPPLPYFVGQVFRVFGFSFLTTVKLTALFQILLAALCMYLLGAEFGGPPAGFLAALFYTYAPYHAVDIYVRGAIHEAWAAVFFPLLFLASYRLIRKQRLADFLLLSLSYGLLVISHTPMPLIFTPFLIAWCLFWLYAQFGLKIKKYLPSILKLFLAVFLGISLASFFLVPSLLEANLSRINGKFEGYFFYADHFANLSQLFVSNFWGDGGSVPGPADGMSFSIGYLHWMLPCLGILLSIYLLLKKQKSALETILPFLFLTFFGFFAAFMAYQGSNFIWSIFKVLQQIQFPWRFLNLVIFFFSAALIFLLLIFEKSGVSRSIRNAAIGLAAAAVILVN